MKKLFLIVFLFLSIGCFAQSKFEKSFRSDSLIENFTFKHREINSIDFQKYLYLNDDNNKLVLVIPKIEKANYYSLKNTTRLLKNEMSDIKPQPIFPDYDKKETLGEAIFSSVLNSVFDK